MSRVTADPLTLIKQASSTVEYYVRDGADFLDRTFGEGYSKKNPVLLGAFITAAAMDFQTSMHTQSADLLSETIANVAEAVSVRDDCDDANYAETIAAAIMGAARHLGTNDAATPMGALEHVAKELRDGLQAIADALDGPTQITGHFEGETPIHVQVWGTDDCGEQVHTVRVRKVNEE